MPNTYFQFRQFRIEQAQSGMKVTTDACLFGSWVANEIKSAEHRRILDIGAGTGILSLMLAQVTKDTKITSVEINKAAYLEARQNFAQSPWSERLDCIHTSLQEFRSGKFDLLICNPPFFQGSQKGSDTNKNQAIHSESLRASDLLHHVLDLLDSGGSFYLLYPEREMNTFIELAVKAGLFPIQKVFVRNQISQPIFRIMVQFCLKDRAISISELIIRNDDRKYTPESWELLKDYLLEYNSPNTMNK
ncbi:MAG: methyltransferase [Ekhidna sp.]|uniref:tRNA1(Val) (adenine(37)-N6)-methyltransferase n=1 Tax=Ekhidna sp. TaxID=2608089 RepID=UPI0032EFC16F